MSVKKKPIIAVLVGIIAWSGCSVASAVDAKKPVASACVSSEAVSADVCDSIFEPVALHVHSPRPIRGSVMDIKWAGDSVIVVRAINTLSGYRLNKDRFTQYFQYELSEGGGIEPSDISVSPDGKWLALAEPQSITLFDLGDGSIAFRRDFKFKSNSLEVTAVAFSSRGFGRFVNEADPKANLVYALSDGKQSMLLVADLFDVIPPKGENSCGRNLCGLTGTSKVIGINPIESSLPGHLGSIFPMSSFAHMDAGRSGFEGLVFDASCKNEKFISAANGNPRKTINDINTLLPCRRYNYPLGQYTIAIFASHPFPNPLANERTFEPVTKGKEMLIAVGSSDKCDGIKIDRISADTKSWRSTLKECIKGEFVGREITALQFSKTGKFIAYGGADTEFGVLSYPGKVHVPVD